VIVRESILDLATPTGPMRTAVFAPVAPNGVARRDGGLVLYSEIFQLTAPECCPPRSDTLRSM
jgi:carboxymethylenebutenolidase